MQASGFQYISNKKGLYGGEGGGGSPSSGGGKLLGYVNHNSTSFPGGAERNDYVKVENSETTFPFTIQGITFTNKNDSAIYTGSQWILYSFIVETNTIEVKDKTKESISGLSTLQNQINEEVVDKIEEIEDKLKDMYRFVGFISTTEPTGENIKVGNLWYNSNVLPTIFPIQVKEYVEIEGVKQWSATTKNYSPVNFDTWSNKQDNQGYYWFSNQWNIIDANVLVDDETIELNNVGELQLKDGNNTTDGIKFNHFNKKIILGGITDDDFYYGFSREYVEEEETKTEYVYTKNLNENVNVYSFNNKEITLLGIGTIENDVLTYNENDFNRYDLNDDYYIDKSDKRIVNGDVALDLFKMIKNLPGQIEYYKEVSSFDGLTGDERTLYYLNTNDGNYKKGFYGYSEVDGFYILVGDSDVFIDVNDLPLTDIENQKIYRLKEYEYVYQGENIDEPNGYSSNNEDVVISNSGITISIEGEEPVEYLFENLTDAILEQLITNEYITTTDFDNSTFFKIDSDVYCYYMEVSKNEVYSLYHNPTSTSSGYLLIGGGSGEVDIDNTTITKNIQRQLQANSILDVNELPASNIKENTIYRIVETTPIRMVKLFQYNNSNWINLSTVNISLANYNLLTENQKNDGTIYIVDGLSSELIQWTYNNLTDKPSINSVSLVNNLTLEDLSLYSRTEINTMIAGKGTAEFVNSVPATTVALTWYYSKKFIDNTDVPNDKRALYIADKDNVLNYMGVVGDVDLSNYYMKSEVDTLLSNKIDTAGDGLSKTGTTLKINNSITANTTNGLKSFAVNKNGLVTAYTTKSLGRGLSDVSNVIGHSNSITAPTAKRILQATYDAQGHVTAIENEFNWSNTYNTSAENQLFTRKGANNMYTELRKVTRYTGNSAMSINNGGGLSSGADYSSEATRTINVVGKSAYFTCHLKYTSSASDAQWVKIGTIPASLRPSNYTTIIGQVYNNGQSSSSPYAGGNEAAGGYVNTSGEVYLWVNKKYAGTNYQIRITAQWFLS